ncbi:MAG: nucleotidyl transferase AbiEii/AbiGii toxin family protein [Bdellovibrionales bacterium]|nr:nucleotidyl transferase AbiEii/AbiGii toxin family protein [Bdellovibrionales bacterium]
MRIFRDQVTSRFQNELSNIGSSDARKNLLREILQEVILCHMKEANLFEDMAFHGGTSLRLLHRIDRFSEDLDMSLLFANKSYDLPAKMKRLETSLINSGFNFEFQDKSKPAKAMKVFYINDSDILNQFTREIGNVIVGEKIKIKFELDVLPSDYQQFTHSKIESTFSATVNAHDLTTCMGQKIHAVLCRSHFYGMDIIKGRDLYDLEWYLEKGVAPNYKNLRECLIRGGPWKQQKLQIDRTWVVTEIHKSLQTKDFFMILEDLRPLVDSGVFQSVSARWNKNYYSQLVEKKIKRF